MTKKEWAALIAALTALVTLANAGARVIVPDEHQPLERLLRLICVHTARSPAEVESCVR